MMHSNVDFFNGLQIALIKSPLIILLTQRQELILKFKKHKIYLLFKDNIWGADLANMQFISKYNKGIRFLSCH